MRAESGTEPSLHKSLTTGTETHLLPSRPPAPRGTDDGDAVGSDGEVQAVWEPEGDPNPAWGVRGLPKEGLSALGPEAEQGLILPGRRRGGSGRGRGVERETEEEKMRRNPFR